MYISVLINIRINRFHSLSLISLLHISSLIKSKQNAYFSYIFILNLINHVALIFLLLLFTYLTITLLKYNVNNYPYILCIHTIFSVINKLMKYKNR
jgi:hypothetical protein